MEKVYNHPLVEFSMVRKFLAINHQDVAKNGVAKISLEINEYV